MTDHSDWEFFQDEGYFGMWCVREKGARRFGEGFHTVSEEEAEALASALSSQSLSLSEAREEIERLKGLVAGIRECPQELPNATVLVTDCAPYLKDGETPRERMDRDFKDSQALLAMLADERKKREAIEIKLQEAQWGRGWALEQVDAAVAAVQSAERQRDEALEALENGPAGLADATSNTPAPDLSSLRKGAEVAVKPLEWVRPPTNITLSRADTILGSYAAWTHHEADGEWYWSGPPMPDNSTVCGAVASEGEAKSAAQSDFETRIRSALIGGGQ